MLELRNVEVNYGPVKAIDNVSLSVEKGELVSILGNNGAGKSTILNSIAGWVPISSGEIILDNSPIHGLPSHEIYEKGVRFVPEEGMLAPFLTVEETLNCSKFSQKENVETILNDFFPHLSKFRDTKASNLSGGERQMLNIARALTSDFKILLVDEPFTGLAPSIVKEMQKYLEEIKHRKKCILLAEQNIKASISIADKNYVFASGKISFEGNEMEMKKTDIMEKLGFKFK